MNSWKPFKSISKALIDNLFPKLCEYCGLTFEEGFSNVLCGSCFRSMPHYRDPVCSHCGESLEPGSFEGALLFRCVECGEGAYFLDQVRTFGEYVGALRLLHHAFKFEGMEHLGLAIAERMANNIPAGFLQPETILCPVPLSPERERERGYNPSENLCRHLSDGKGVHWENLLRKMKSIPPQMSLTRKERLMNPVGAYEVLRGKAVPVRVVLVDDVFTTGATLEECAKILKQSGCQWVGAVLWGRTPRYF